ncbi:tRNA lysidine(34) synthetase TilS [Kordiimonas marina]|uniref:tRNA lysidine(34) synthetase TilS n=1 Tax=Kordiimonas marina TaxID=2872312 RepID=UPI001FF47833|nr:tRNA lysidine(34) synthetase TilS [Kordiimonas marina]MCJ9427608.1 tRNA lysidine(34) synthetase TilS [Kordiimonas marina]
MVSADPLTAQEVAVALDACRIGADEQVAIAVSGGADSLCLGLMVAALRPAVCLTVDHGLRPEAADEAAMVHDLLAARGIAHETLVWEGEKPSANIQAAARGARYRLLCDWCRDKGIKWLLTAHHQDDQAETLLLRLARGSGVYGLAAMAPVSKPPVGDVPPRLVRPFLDFPKARLIATLEAMGVTWVEDPSNSSLSYDRVKVRALLADPPLEGLSAQRLADTARRLRRSRDALEYYEHLWLRDAARLRPEGHAFLNPDLLDAAPEDIVLRGLASLCRMIGGRPYVPRFEKLERLLEALMGDEFSGQTLDGVQFAPNPGGSIIVFRELAAIGPAEPLVDQTDWDNRFDICARGDIAKLKIGALGEKGWAQLVADRPEMRDCGLPYPVRLVLPAVFDEDCLQAVPHLGYSVRDDLTVTLTPKWLTLSKK